MFTYDLHNNSADELPMRQVYQLHTFRPYALEMERTSSYVELRSFPFKKTEISILYGHFPWVCEYLCSHGEDLCDTAETLNTCCPDDLASSLGPQQVCSRKADQCGEAVRRGEETYSFPFDATASELDALNTAHLPLEKQLRFVYKKVS